MQLRAKALTNVCAAYEQVDKIMRMQGFCRFRSHAPIYRLHMRDLASGQVYRLSLPTRQMKTRHETTLSLEQPTLESASHLRRHQRNLAIPNEVIMAAQEKLEEIASYLK
jgi:hypothetical protein